MIGARYTAFSSGQANIHAVRAQRPAAAARTAAATRIRIGRRRLPFEKGDRGQLHLRRRLRGRVPGLPIPTWGNPWSPHEPPPSDPVTEANYTSGDDFVVEFLGYRFGFNQDDFEQRVTAAAVKLGLIEA